MNQNWNQYFFNFILTNFGNKHRNWYGLSSNPNITIEIVNANPDKPWNWYGLSSNPNITMEIVNANPDKHWNWYGLSWNPNITIEFVNANLDKPWSWDGLSINNFSKEKELFNLRVKYQKYVKNNLFEEIVKKVWHPNKIIKYLEMGYSIDDIDLL